MHLAIKADEEEVVKILLQSGADPTVLGRNTQTPLQMAMLLKKPTIVKLLESQKNPMKTSSG